MTLQFHFLLLSWLRLRIAFFTALLAVARETEPVLGAAWTFRVVTEHSASILAASDFAFALDEVPRVLPALLATAFVTTFTPGMEAP